MKKLIAFFAITLVFAAAATSAYAHSGRTNRWGCHYNRTTGVYHCH